MPDLRALTHFLRCVLLSLALGAVTVCAADTPPEEKPVFTCVANGEKIEVFVRIAPFDAAKHVFQRTDSNLFGFQTWLVDGKPFRGENIMLRWDGCPAMADIFDPAKLTSIVESVEVRWNGKPGQVKGPEAICFSPTLDTDLSAERHLRFQPTPDGREVFVQLETRDSSVIQPWVWHAWKEGEQPAAVFGALPSQASTPVLACEANGENVKLFFGTKEFDAKAHKISFRKAAGGDWAELLVDGRPAFGTDNDPRTLKSEVDVFAVQLDGKEIPIPRELFSDCFNPGRLYCFPAPDGQSMLIHLSGGDGGGSYGAGWMLRKDGKHARVPGPAWAEP